LVRKLQSDMNNLTQGSDSAQPRSVTESEQTLETDGLSSALSVESRALSCVLDVQRTGSLEMSLSASPATVRSAVSVEEDQEHFPECAPDAMPPDVKRGLSNESESKLFGENNSNTSEHSPQELRSNVAGERNSDGHIKNAENLHGCDESEVRETSDIACSEAPDRLSVQLNCETVSEDDHLVSEENLGELVSCAECGSSGLWNFFCGWMKIASDAVSLSSLS